MALLHKPSHSELKMLDEYFVGLNVISVEKANSSFIFRCDGLDSPEKIILANNLLEEINQKIYSNYRLISLYTTKIDNSLK